MVAIQLVGCVFTDPQGGSRLERLLESLNPDRIIVPASQSDHAVARIFQPLISQVAALVRPEDQQAVSDVYNNLGFEFKVSASYGQRCNREVVYMFQSSGMLYQGFLKAGLKFSAAWLRFLRPLARFESWMRGVPFPPPYNRDRLNEQQEAADSQYTIANMAISPPSLPEYETRVRETQATLSCSEANNRSFHLAQSMCLLDLPGSPRSTVVLVPLRDIFDDSHLMTTLYSQLKTRKEVVRRTLADPLSWGSEYSLDDKREFLKSRGLHVPSQNPNVFRGFDLY